MLICIGHCTPLSFFFPFEREEKWRPDVKSSSKKATRSKSLIQTGFFFFFFTFLSIISISLLFALH